MESHSVKSLDVRLLEHPAHHLSCDTDWVNWKKRGTYLRIQKYCFRYTALGFLPSAPVYFANDVERNNPSAKLGDWLIGSPRYLM